MILSATTRPVRERVWGDESVVYDLYSGETHYLDRIACAIFHCVRAASPIDLDSLCTVLAALESEVVRAISPEDIGIIVARLRDLGLVRVDDNGN